MLSDIDPALEGRWPRAIAVLARSGLEQLLAEYWGIVEPAMINASMRAQLLCLASYLDDANLAASVGYVYGVLSDVCHYRSYELPPTAHELEAWLESIGSFARVVEG